MAGLEQGQVLGAVEGMRFRLLAKYGVMCAVGALGALMTPSASACSTIAPPPALNGYPSDGATDVPTDVVPFYKSIYSTSLNDATFSLTSATGEAMVARATTAQLDTYELRFEQELQPNTTYTLVTDVPDPVAEAQVRSLSLTFTTGGGPVSTAPAKPEGSLQHYQFASQPRSSCSPSGQGTCVAVSGLPVESSEIDEFGQDNSVSLYTEPWFTNLSGINQGTNFRCVKLRTRAPNATYSEPLVLCGEGAPLITIRGSENIACTSQGITQDGLPIMNVGAGGGCSLALHDKRSAHEAFGALLALAMLARFRKSRRERPTNPE
ncbi:MAG TPA: Ig-like domain-containing protein [Polyangiaceae bacterium]|nr:Ig-like domain-containing protein [Polyangiaceae bacterium]